MKALNFGIGTTKTLYNERGLKSIVEKIKKLQCAKICDTKSALFQK